MKEKEEIIKKVSSILEEWNPLGEAASSAEQLEGYRYEAIDIISTIGLLGSDKVEESIEQVLTQSFGITLLRQQLARAAKEISLVIGVSN